MKGFFDILTLGRRSMQAHFFFRAVDKAPSKAMVDFLIRTKGLPDYREQPGPGKKIIIIGNGGRPNVPKSHYVQINDPILRPHHCMLVKGRFKGWRIEPLNNGCLCDLEVDGEPAEHPLPLNEGTRIGIGNTTIMVRFQEA